MFEFTFTDYSFAEGIAWILGLLRYKIDQDVEAGRIKAVLASILHDHVQHIAHRIATLLARLPITIKRIPHARPAKPAPAEPAEPAFRLPRGRRFLPGGHDWMRRCLNDRESRIVGQSEAWLYAMLRDDETIARIAADPALARAIRVLCRMLGTPIPERLRLPKRPWQPKLTIERIAKPRKPREPRHHAALFEDLRTPAHAVDITWQPNRTTPWRKPET